MIPRGIRNNSPGNIRRIEGMHWLGESSDQADPDFVQFSDPVYGLRAIVRIMRSYKREGVNTLCAAISRWAPASENNTNAYIDSVCHLCQIDRLAVVDLDLVMPELVQAIVLHENGENPYPDSLISQAILLA